MPDVSELIITRNAWRERLDSEDRATLERLLRANERMLSRLEKPTADFLGVYGRLTVDGGTISVAELGRISTFERLVVQIALETEGFARLVADESRTISESAIGMGLDASEELTAAVAGELRPAVQAAWVSPDPAAVARVARYVDSSAFASKIAAYGEAQAEFVRDSIISLTAQGKGSRSIARFIEGWTRMPYTHAENTVRTMQAYSYRAGIHAGYRQNGRIVRGWMWWATLDSRTCISCISKHGQVFALSEELNDHHRGRCTPLPLVEGSSALVGVETGPEWFSRQPMDTQKKIAGLRLLEALGRADVSWQDLSEPYESDIYGEMMRVPSLRSLGIGR